MRGGERREERGERREERGERGASMSLHFYSFDFDTPGVCGLVEGLLHDVADGFAFGQNLGQVLRAQYVAEGGGS